LDFSANLGVSQLKAGDVVEKDRAREKAARGLDKPAWNGLVSSRGDHLGGER
jgi:hypothetical protein